MSLPLSDAREIFEREYLMPRSTDWRNISRTRSSSAWSARRCTGKAALGVNSNERGSEVGIEAAAAAT